MKSLNLGRNTPYLRVFGLEFLKTIVIFETSTLCIPLRGHLPLGGHISTIPEDQSSFLKE